LDEPLPEWLPTKWLKSKPGAVYDDITGFELPDQLVQLARQEELGYLVDKICIWKITDVSECIAVTGYSPISVRWVDLNRGDLENPEIRSRLCVQETRRVSGHMDPGEVFSGTPPLECLRMLASVCMCVEAATIESDDVVMLFLDVSRAHQHALMRRDLYTCLPPEHPASQDKTKCGKLVYTLQGARDAGQNWEYLVFDICDNAGATRGESNPCVYRHDAWGIGFFHHGDDFVVTGRRSGTVKLKEALAGSLIIKDRGTLGPRAKDLKEIVILHRLLRWRAQDHNQRERIEYQADPRHAEMLLLQLQLNGQGRGITTPGVKVEPTDANMKKLDEDEGALYRSACMRLGYLAQDRPTLQYIAKECARGMSQPCGRDFERLKRAVRFLKSHPVEVWVWMRQRWPKVLYGKSDTDWAGCPLTRKSTNGTAIMFGTHCWLTQSSTQGPIALSSGEAEHYGTVKTACRLLGSGQLMLDFGLQRYGTWELVLQSDSSAAIGIAVRRGTGRIRHMETGGLWLQKAIGDKRLRIEKILGKINPADLMTKSVDRATLERLVVIFGLRFEFDRTKLIPNLQVEGGTSQ
jgi:hypothetical protein